MGGHTSCECGHFPKAADGSRRGMPAVKLETPTPAGGVVADELEPKEQAFLKFGFVHRFFECKTCQGRVLLCACCGDLMPLCTNAGDRQCNRGARRPGPASARRLRPTRADAARPTAATDHMQNPFGTSARCRKMTVQLLSHFADAITLVRRAQKLAPDEAVPGALAVRAMYDGRRSRARASLAFRVREFRVSRAPPRVRRSGTSCSGWHFTPRRRRATLCASIWRTARGCG